MKFSWTSIRISIAGAKLSHLVQKDRIWDHGSMTEQARIIFYLVHKAAHTGNADSLKKYMSLSCFENLNRRFDELHQHESTVKYESPVITELAVISVKPGKKNRPDMFTALISGYMKKNTGENMPGDSHSKKFSETWSFVRQGEWWMLNEIRTG